MKLYVICKAEDNTYYTGTSYKGGHGNKSPVFTPSEDKAKVFRLLKHARIARSKMGKFEKISNIDILELETTILGKH
jgi:hypothetical protein